MNSPPSESTFNAYVPVSRFPLPTALTAVAAGNPASIIAVFVWLILFCLMIAITSFIRRLLVRQAQVSLAPLEIV